MSLIAPTQIARGLCPRRVTMSAVLWWIMRILLDRILMVVLQIQY